MAEDERKQLLGKIDSLESIVKMLELKTKNSHDHGTDTTAFERIPHCRVVLTFPFIWFSSFIVNIFYLSYSLFDNFSYNFVTSHSYPF